MTTAMRNRSAIWRGLVPLAAILQAAVVECQMTSTSTATSTTSSASDAVQCSWDGSVGDYLMCQKNVIPTSTLLVVGIGVTVGILVVVGAGVWLCNRQRQRRAAQNLPDSKQTEEGRARQQPDSDIDTDQDPGNDDETKRDSDDQDVGSRNEKYEKSHEQSRKYDATEHPRDPRAARVESASSTDGTVTPPPPHPAHAPLAKQGSMDVGSPTVERTERTLYPSNPSPTPRQRHLTPGQPPEQLPPSAMRSSVYSKRQSMASVHFSGDARGQDVPPVPLNKPQNSTAPLNIRKSYMDGPSRKASNLVPSYYEATHGHSLPLPASRATSRPGTAYSTRMGGSAQQVPAVPLATRPRPDARGPSAPEARRPSDGRRPSQSRGGMI